MFRNTYLLWLSALLLIGCATTKPERASSTMGISSTSWQMVQLAQRETTPKDDNYTINFAADSTIASKGACNRIMGRYTQGADGALKLHLGGMTMMMCHDDVAEREFVETLSRVERYYLQGSELLLEGGGEILMRLNAYRGK